MGTLAADWTFLILAGQLSENKTMGSLSVPTLYPLREAPDPAKSVTPRSPHNDINDIIVGRNRAHKPETQAKGIQK